MSINPRTFLMSCLKQLGVVLVYLFFSYTLLHGFTVVNSLTSLFWPDIGLALAALLIGGRQYLWGVSLSILLVHTFSSHSFSWLIIATTVNLFEALFGVFLLTRNNQSALSLRTPSDYLRLIGLGGGIACGIGALIGALALLCAGIITTADYFKNVLNWWMGDAFGVVLVTPFILVWYQEKLNKMTIGQVLEGLLLVGITFLVGQAVFLEWFSQYLVIRPRGYWIFLFVSWVAMRMGTRGVTLVTLMIAIQSLLGLHYQIGLFTHELTKTNIYNYWFYILVLSIVGISLATYVDNIKNILIALAKSEEHLCNILNTARDAIITIEAETGTITVWNPAAEALFGYSYEEATSLLGGGVSPRLFSSSPLP